MHLGLEPGPQRDQLVPVADQLPQLPHLRRRDPRLRQPTQAQQVGQVGGVAVVVLDPPVAPVVAQRVGQMHRRAPLAAAGPPPSTSRRWPPSPPPGPGPPWPTPPPTPPGRCRSAPRRSTSPCSVSRTITDRRRCRSIPTYCCCSIGVFLSFSLRVGNVPEQTRVSQHQVPASEGGTPRTTAPPTERDRTHGNPLTTDKLTQERYRFFSSHQWCDRPEPTRRAMVGRPPDSHHSSLRGTPSGGQPPSASEGRMEPLVPPSDRGPPCPRVDGTA